MVGRLEDEASAVAQEIGDEEAYDSAEDEDFQLDEADGDLVSHSSSSEGEGEEGEAARPTKKRKLDKGPAKRKKDQAAEDEAELDSGDEATIRKAREKKKKRKSGKGKGDADDDDDIDFDDDDEGGEGGFVKTRAMRMQMQEERKPLAKIDGATIDVDALWAKMNAGGPGPGLLPETTDTQDKNADNAQDEQKEQRDEDLNVKAGQSQPPEKLPSEEMVKIKRTYKFAGEMITEEKVVPRDSAEAKLFLAESKGEDVNVESELSAAKLRRPLRRISRFDPNPQGLIKKNWEKQAIATDEATGPKLNTVEKSRLDWAQYVDEAGIKDELNVHSKAKEGYLGRMDFLDRVDSKREEERRNIRLRGL